MGIENGMMVPAIGELRPDFFEVCVTHVLHAEHKTVLMGVGGLANVRVQALGKLLALLLGLGKMYHFRSLGFGHCDSGSPVTSIEI